MKEIQFQVNLFKKLQVQVLKHFIQLQVQMQVRFIISLHIKKLQVYFIQLQVHK